MGKRGRPCTVCQHPKRDEIDKRLAIDSNFAGISRDFAGISEDALKRHKEKHLPGTLAKAENIKEVVKADALLEDVKSLRKKALGILESAEKAGDLKTALLGIREARSCMELLAKVEGQLKETPQINFILSAEWIELRTLIITALDPYPEAKEAMVLAIRGR
jgi:hypothetical protein